MGPALRLATGCAWAAAQQSTAAAALVDDDSGQVAVVSREEWISQAQRPAVKQ